MTGELELKSKRGRNSILGLKIIVQKTFSYYKKSFGIIPHCQKSIWLDCSNCCLGLFKFTFNRLFVLTAKMEKKS